MAGINVGSVEVSVVPDARNFNRDLAAQLNPAAKKAGEQAGQEFSKGVEDTVKRRPPKTEMPAPDTKKSDAEVDRFLRDFNAKMRKQYQETGNDSGGLLAQGLRNGFMANSPLIAGAIAGGLALGAPAVMAGAGLMFAGLAVVAEKSNADLKAAASSAADTIKTTFASAAQVTVPMFESALKRVTQAVVDLRPQLSDAFTALGGPLDSLTTGVVNLVQNAMPGLVAMLRNAGPVFSGLSTLLSEVGTGLGKMFQLISEHGSAGGQVLQAIGKIVGDLLPVLGEFVGAGSELAAQILPPLASVLHVVAVALEAIAPVLPGVVAAFLALKGVQAINGPLASLAQNLASASYNGGLLGKAAGAASTGVSGLRSALGPLAAATVVYSLQQSLMTQLTEQWAAALAKGGQAAAEARDQMDKTHKFGQTFGTGILGLIGNLTGYKSALDFAKTAGQDLTTQSLTPLGQKQQDVTQATTELQEAILRWGANSGQAAGAAANLRDKQQALADLQAGLKAATDGTSVAAQTNAQRLQSIADQAGAANTQINLLKGALDALTGKTITADQAEIAITQSIAAVTQAVQSHSAALAFNHGQLDLSNEKSAAAAQLLIALSGTMHQEIATMEQQGATSDVVNAKADALRQQFIKQAEQLGATADEAKTLADRYFGIPGQVHTDISTNVAAVSADVRNFQTQIDNLHGTTVTIETNADRSVTAFLGSTSARAGRGVVVSNAEGGPIQGPGTGTSDSILSWVSNGEYVVKADSVKQYGLGMMNAINAGAFPAFASGGPVISGDFSPLTNIMGAFVTAAKTLPSYTGGGMWRALGQQIAAQMGFGGQFSSIDYIFTHESGWNNLAQNPTSTAFGIPQFLNSTWGAYGGKTTDPGTQIRDGIRYMVDRYGSPNAAAAFWQGHHWYHDGGVVTGPAGANVPAVLKVGETVRTEQQEAALHRPMQITGRLEIGGDGMATLVGTAVDMLHDRSVYNP